MQSKRKAKSSRQSQLDFISKVSGNQQALVHGKGQMNNYFLNPSSKEYQAVRDNLKFSERSFLLPHEQIEEHADCIITTLEHFCANPVCQKLIDSNRILENARGSYFTDTRSGATRRRFHWECYNCASEIFPRIKVRASRNKERRFEKTPLFHAV